MSTDTDFIVSPFTIVVDTREQAPWQFKGMCADAKDKGKPLLVKVIEESLETGDYSIEGLENRVAIERKSHSDLIGSVSHGRRRFEAEFDRMSHLDYAAVVVEASVSQILHQPPRHSRMNPKAVIRTAFSWSVKYRVAWWFMPSRPHAEVAAYRLLEQFWKHHKEGDVIRRVA